MGTRAMTKTIILGSIVLMFIGTGMIATAYHISDQVAPHCIEGSHPPKGTNPGGMGVGPTDCDNPATQWVSVTAPAATVICESEGPNDKQNPQNDKIRGTNGLCYASSDHDDTKKSPDAGDKKDKVPRYDPNDVNNTDVTKWSQITPTCEPLDDNPNPNGIFPAHPATGCDIAQVGWFAALGVGGFGCSGFWGQTYYYPEFAAWTWGHVAGSNAPDGTGHVTFFVDDAGTAGSYQFENDIEQAPLDNARAARTCTSPNGMTFVS